MTRTTRTIRRSVNIYPADWRCCSQSGAGLAWPDWTINDGAAPPRPQSLSDTAEPARAELEQSEESTLNTASHVHSGKSSLSPSLHIHPSKLPSPSLTFPAAGSSFLSRCRRLRPKFGSERCENPERAEIRCWRRQVRVSLRPGGRDDVQGGDDCWRWEDRSVQLHWRERWDHHSEVHRG